MSSPVYSELDFCQGERERDQRMMTINDLANKGHECMNGNDDSEKAIFIEPMNWSW